MNLMFETTLEFKMVVMLNDKQRRTYTDFSKMSVFQAFFTPFLGQNWVKRGKMHRLYYKCDKKLCQKLPFAILSIWGNPIMRCMSSNAGVLSS